MKMFGKRPSSQLIYIETTTEPTSAAQIDDMLRSIDINPVTGTCVAIGALTSNTLPVLKKQDNGDYYGVVADISGVTLS